MNGNIGIKLKLEKYKLKVLLKKKCTNILYMNGQKQMFQDSCS